MDGALTASGGGVGKVLKSSLQRTHWCCHTLDSQLGPCHQMDLTVVLFVYLFV